MCFKKSIAPTFYRKYCDGKYANTVNKAIRKCKKKSLKRQANREDVKKLVNLYTSY